MEARSSRSLVTALAVGVLLLIAGLAAGARTLPAAHVGDLLPPERYVAAYDALARRQGAELASAPHQRLLNVGDDTKVARQILGDAADDWLVRQGRGLLVEVVQGAEWGGLQGQLAITFTARGAPVLAEWQPAAMSDFWNPRARQPEGICGLLLGRGESLGAAVPFVGSTQQAITLAPVTGAVDATHVYRIDPPGGTVVCGRRPGSPRAGLAVLDTDFGGLPALLPALLFIGVEVLLFIVLAFRGRVDVWNAALLAAAFFVTCLLGDWPANLPMALLRGAGVPIAAVILLCVWAAAESWARTHLPSFTTSLDTLRRGKLGARSGRELLFGFAGGAGLAGLRILLLAAAAALPRLAPGETSAPLPLFALRSHPLLHGITWAGALLVLLTFAQTRLPRRARWLALLLVPLVAQPVVLEPWWATYVAGLVATLALLLVLRQGGIAAGLVAATLAYWIPSGLLALRYPGWLAVTLAVSMVATLLPLVAGVVGLKRGAAVEHDPGAVPEFVRREERERRLTYEMDLLSRMQLGLLPQSLPRLAGYEVTARSLLATEAGGDLYDFLRDERGRLWIAAGDVSGHGYSCAIGQATVKAGLLSLVDGNAAPARVLDRMDRVLRGSSVGARMFATLTLLYLEEATGRMVIANAGHPFPVIVEPKVGAREVELPGLPLGQGPPRHYREVEVTLPRGGVLLLFSDGLYEATDPNGHPYGFDRPRQVLADAAGWNAAEVLERLVYDWRRHLAGNPSADDTTLVVLKRL